MELAEDLEARLAVVADAYDASPEVLVRRALELFLAGAEEHIAAIAEARADVDAGRTYSLEDIEARFAELRLKHDPRAA